MGQNEAFGAEFGVAVAQGGVVEVLGAGLVEGVGVADKQVGVTGERGERICPIRVARVGEDLVPKRVP